MSANKRTVSFIYPSLIFLSLSGCLSKTPETQGKNICAYSQNLKTQEAWLVLEWSGRPAILASGFLVDKEKGIFMTAEHFTEGVHGFFGKIKIFFNCKIYEGEVLALPPIRDAALIHITGNFNPAGFPEPYPLFTAPPKVGDKVYVRGFHPHPFLLADSLNARGAVPINVLIDYYKIVMIDVQKKTEIVFENLEGEILDLSQQIPVRSNDATPTLSEKIRDATMVYFSVATRFNHMISFGGLSGGPVLNERGELIGIVTAEAPLRFEYDDRGSLKSPKDTDSTFQSGRFIKDRISITPIESIRELFAKIEELKE